MIHSRKWIFIRFNPDRTLTDKTDIEDRITQLLEEMENQIERIKNNENEELVEIIKMFY
jgi:phosphopantothenate synthetase